MVGLALVLTVLVAFSLGGAPLDMLPNFMGGPNSNI